MAWAPSLVVKVFLGTVVPFSTEPAAGASPDNGSVGRHLTQKGHAGREKRTIAFRGNKAVCVLLAGKPVSGAHGRRLSAVVLLT